MEENLPEGLSVFACPEAYWGKLRTSNLAERINKEIKRRTRVVGIFPNGEACLRLVSALLIEQDEEWSQAKAYLAVDKA
jgi:transposase-like protein